jgi:hypothetical protein
MDRDMTEGLQAWSAPTVTNLGSVNEAKLGTTSGTDGLLQGDAVASG